MKYKILSIIAIVGLSFFMINNQEESRETYEEYINQHPYNLESRTNEDLKEVPKYDRPDLAMQQDFLATMDPVLKRPANERLYATMEKLQLEQKAFKTSANTWTERGPNNVAGRTRGLFFDPNDATGKKVWAAGVAGGVWYNNDITSVLSAWTSVDDFWSNMAVSCMTYDPTNTQVFYAGTGEGWYNQSAVRGDGIWKSSNGGTTWARLTSTANVSAFRYVQDIDVHPITGDLYASTRSGGLRKSTDGGVSWTQVLSGNITSVDISSNGLIWAAVRSGGIYTSKVGDLSTWTKVTTNNGFNSSSMGRIDLVVAPSDTAVCYSIVAVNNKVGGIYKTSNSGSTWTSLTEPNDVDGGIPSGDFSRGQAWFDLAMAVDPNDADEIIVGAVDLFKSSNGGSSWTQLSHWYGGYNKQYVHADQHKIVYKPGSSTEVIFGNDGGVFYSNNANSSGVMNIYERNNEYNVTQFYAVAMHPTSGTDYYLAGAQDNGTQRFNQSGMNSTTQATGGDGAFCFIDQTNPNYQITSYVYNNFRFSSNSGQSFSNITSDNTGSFINPADYDDNQDVLYSSRSSNTIKRVYIDGTKYPYDDNLSVTLYSSASALKVSPYTTTSTTLFVGTQSGRVFKITKADGSSSSSTEIGGSSFPNGNISSVELGSSESEIIVTFSNYGVSSIWYTYNGGTTWLNKEGNLPDMPIRWSLMNPNDSNEVVLATELGVWSTKNFQTSSPTWSSTTANSGLSNTSVRMLQIRDSDMQVAAASFGRGMFTSNIFNDPNPNVIFNSDTKVICINDVPDINNLTTNANSYNWTITPNTVSFINGTSATSFEPEIQFSTKGKYTVTLSATNATSTQTYVDTIIVGGLELPFLEGFNNSSFSSLWTTSNSDDDITWEEVSKNGDYYAGIYNFNYSSADSGLGTKIDDLISPPLDFTNHSYVHMSFEYAYTDQVDKTDSLGIYVSEDCGSTWTLLRVMKEDGSNNFITRPKKSTFFSPSNSADWCTQSFINIGDCPYVDLSAYAGKESVKVMFRNFSNNGNNFYLDNINISSSSIGIVEEEKEAMFSIFPNPAKDYFNIDFKQLEIETADVLILDVAGRVLQNNSYKNLAGQKGIRIELNSLQSGAYIVWIKSNKGELKETILVQ